MKNENTSFSECEIDDEIDDEWTGLEDEPDDEITLKIIESLEREAEDKTEKNANHKAACGAHEEKSTSKVMHEAELERGLQILAEIENAEDADTESEDDLEELEEEYEYRSDTFGESDLRTVRAKYNLAMAYWRRGDECATYQLLLEVYLAWKGVKKPKDAEMLELRHTLGLAALECEYPDEAYTILKEVYELRCEAFGEKDEDAIETLVALIKACNHLNHQIIYKKYIEKYEALTGKKFDEKHQ